MCGEAWLAAAASFLGKWVMMMVAMMLPSLVPMLWRYRQGDRQDRRDTPRSAHGAGQHWVLLRVDPVGMAAFPVGVALTAIEDAAAGVGARFRSRSAWSPHIVGGRRHRLAIRLAPRSLLHLWLCRLMAILLVIGIMDLRATAIVTAAITVERLAPAGERVARAVGGVVVVAGLFLIARAAGFG